MEIEYSKNESWATRWEKVLNLESAMVLKELLKNLGKGRNLELNWKQNMPLKKKGIQNLIFHQMLILFMRLNWKTLKR